jgi:hypothetical protein
MLCIHIASLLYRLWFILLLGWFVLLHGLSVYPRHFDVFWHCRHFSYYGLIRDHILFRVSGLRTYSLHIKVYGHLSSRRWVSYCVQSIEYPYYHTHRNTWADRILRFLVFFWRYFLNCRLVFAFHEDCFSNLSQRGSFCWSRQMKLPFGHLQICNRCFDWRLSYTNNPLTTSSTDLDKL